MPIGSKSTPDIDKKLKVLGTLIKHRKKNFIHRALYPDSSPKLDLGNGHHASHLMSWTSSTDKDGKQQHHVYPNVVQKPGRRTVEMLAADKAFGYARKANEFITFEDPEEADEFSREYKSLWRKK